MRATNWDNLQRQGMIGEEGSGSLGYAEEDAPLGSCMHGGGGVAPFEAFDWAGAHSAVSLIT
jgi:hypothetical protein